MQASMMALHQGDRVIRCKLLCRPFAEVVASWCTASAAAMQTCKRHLSLDTLAADPGMLSSEVFQQSCPVNKPDMLSNVQVITTLAHCTFKLMMSKHRYLCQEVPMKLA